MSHIGRNEPCPCGSGRKYKHCCLRSHDDLETRWRQLRSAEGRMIPELMRVALDAWGADGFHEAQRRFYKGFEVPEEPTSEREFESLFLTWFALRFAPKRPRGGAPADPAARQWLDDPSTAADPDRRFVAELVTRPLSFHHIVAVEPGRSIDLEDLLTGETCRVMERSASTVVKRGGVLFARTITMDGISILVGCGAAAIPPAYRIDLARLRDTLTENGDHLSAEELLSLDDELRHAYLSIAGEIFNPRPPRLRNTDGDPLAPTTLHFDLDATVSETWAALQSLDAASAHGQPVESTLDGNGDLESFTVNWTKPGNRLHASWDNTILGTVTATAGGLSATVNSRRRATRLRREIEKRLGRRVTFLRSVEESVDALLAEARKHPSPEEPLAPELAAATAAIAERQWTEWLDTPVPALANQTPREAAKTPDGRERLSALLDDFEWHDRDAQAPPVARLRAELGFNTP